LIGRRIVEAERKYDFKNLEWRYEGRWQNLGAKFQTSSGHLLELYKNAKLHLESNHQAAGAAMLRVYHS
jgi:hypothetical protein